MNLDFNYLLDKAKVEVDFNAIYNLINNKNIMVTGAGGSIGSELVRQICKYNPKSITFFDRNEEKVFYLEREVSTNTQIPITVRLGSITDRKRSDLIFEECKPDIVFHTAANKHVPLSEENPQETFLNNVGGTMVLVEAALRHKCKNFIFVSTDKAVNPSSIMGHTKRLCELYIQAIWSSFNRNIDIAFTIVRFGNVIGSSGSVAEIFKKQLEIGNTVTITDLDMTRYFLTIPDACNLLLQCSSFGVDGVYVLDMGDPIFIADIAKRMANILNVENLEFKVVGVRKGEKITEELVSSNEKTTVTSHTQIKKIMPVEKQWGTYYLNLCLLLNEADYLTKDELKKRIIQL